MSEVTFTHDDIEFLELVAGQVTALRLGPEKADVLRDLADRIAALLPPKVAQSAGSP